MKDFATTRFYNKQIIHNKSCVMWNVSLYSDKQKKNINELSICWVNFGWIQIFFSFFSTHEIFYQRLFLGHLSTFFSANILDWYVPPIHLTTDSCTCGFLLLLAFLNIIYWIQVCFELNTIVLYIEPNVWTRESNNFSPLWAHHIQFDFCARSCQRKSIGQFF